MATGYSLYLFSTRAELGFSGNLRRGFEKTSKIAFYFDLLVTSKEQFNHR